MYLLGFATALLLISTAEGQATTSLSTAVYNPLATSVVIDFPPCNYTGKSATLFILKDSVQVTNATFVVPQCRIKRDLIILSSSENGNVWIENVGFQITGLTNSTNYTAYYTIEAETMKSISFTTINMSSTVPEIMARSGGMVVITVLLSTAMFLLIGGLIGTLVIGGTGRK
ncbi:uroplakin-2 [Rhinophrynus dorsalis]